MKIPKKAQNKRSHPIVKLFRSLTEGTDYLNEETMVKLRGNPDSRRLLVAPPCLPEEYAAKIPFCADAARMFHEVLADVNLSTQNDFLVMSCSTFGKKPSRNSTEAIRQFIKASTDRKMFDFYVCVGDEAFKHIFGAGKKPSSSTLYGSTVFIADTGHKPLFTFPDPTFLVMPQVDEPWQVNRAERIQTEWVTKFRRFAKALAASLKQNTK